MSESIAALAAGDATPAALGDGTHTRTGFDGAMAEVKQQADADGI